MMLSQLIAAVVKQRQCAELTYKRGLVSWKSMRQLIALLDMPPPYNLLELRLVNCDTTPKVLYEIVNHLGFQASNLRHLALVQMKMNFPLDELGDMIKESRTLIDLDISGNDCQPLHFVPLLLALTQNHVLQTLNLSWNTILDRSDQISKLDDDEDAELTTETLNEMTEQGRINSLTDEESHYEIKRKDMPLLLIQCIT